MCGFLTMGIGNHCENLSCINRTIFPLISACPEVMLYTFPPEETLAVPMTIISAPNCPATLPPQQHCLTEHPHSLASLLEPAPAGGLLRQNPYRRIPESLVSAKSVGTLSIRFSSRTRKIIRGLFMELSRVCERCLILHHLIQHRRNLCGDGHLPVSIGP